MLHLRQEILHDEEAGDVGDCWRTCIAMCVGATSPDDIPHFVEMQVKHEQGHHLRLARNWLGQHGMFLVRIDFPGMLSMDDMLQRALPNNFPGLPVILGGVSPRERNHSVVWYDGRIYDPHPSDDGLIRPFVAYEDDPDTSVWSVEVIGSRLHEMRS